MADPGEANEVSVWMDATDIHVNDDGRALSTGAGCIAGGVSDTARCDRTGIDEIVVDLGDGADRLYAPSADLR